MKSISFILSLTICFSLTSQTFTTSQPIDVTTGHGYYHPQIELTNDDKPLILWTNQVSKEVNLSKYLGNNTFSPPLVVSPIGFDVQTYNWSGPDLAIENENIYLTFRSLGYSTGHIYTVKSTDNGLTFSDTVKVDNLLDGYGQYPDIAVLHDTVWVTFMAHSNTSINPQYVVARSVDGGLTYDNAVTAGEIVGQEACDCCQPEIIVNDDYVIVYFRNNDNNIRDIKGVISYDRGATFTDWFSVDNHQWLINACPSTGPDTRFLNDSTSVTIYKTEETGTGKLFINEYNHNSNTSVVLTEILDLNSTNNSINYPQIDIKNTNIGIVWEAQGQGSDIFINYSSNGVAGLDPQNVQNLTDITGPQLRPDIAVGNAKFHIVYVDATSNGLKYMEVQAVNSIPKHKNQFDLETIITNSVVIITSEAFLKSKANIKIYSILGHSVYSKSSNSKESISINTEKWVKGLYILTVEIDEELQSIKLVID